MRLKLEPTSYISPLLNALIPLKRPPLLTPSITCKYAMSCGSIMFFIGCNRKITKFGVSTDGDVIRISEHDVPLQSRTIDGAEDGLSIQNGYVIFFRCGINDTCFELVHIDTGRAVTCPLTVCFGFAYTAQDNLNDYANHRAYPQTAVKI